MFLINRSLIYSSNQKISLKIDTVASTQRDFLEQTVLALPKKAIHISSNEQNPSVVPCLVTWHSGCSKTWDEQEKKRKRHLERFVKRAFTLKPYL